MEQIYPATFLPLARDAENATKHKPKPVRAPLFIQDAVTPWGEETLLLALWRLQETPHQDS